MLRLFFATSRRAFILCSACILLVGLIALDGLRPTRHTASDRARVFEAPEVISSGADFEKEALELHKRMSEKWSDMTGIKTVTKVVSDRDSKKKGKQARVQTEAKEVEAKEVQGAPKPSPSSWEDAIPGYLHENNRVSKGHWLLDRFMAVPRRNQHCFLEDAHPELKLGERLTLVAGRHAPNIEVMDLDSGKPSEVVLTDEEKLNINHVGVVAAGDHEWWVPCGLEGHRVNKETSMERITVIKRALVEGKGYEWAVSKGPKLDIPRGACAALPVSLDGPNERPNVCVIGGSSGSHNKPVFQGAASCYSHKRQEWRKLPDLPYGIDHGNAVLVPAGTCHKDDPARVIVLSYRIEAYGHARPEILSLDLPKEDQTGALQLPPAGTTKWDLYYNDTGIIPADAAAVVPSRDGRYLFKIGGVKHPRPGKNMDTVHAFSVCQRRWLSDLTKLYVPRFAILSCESSRGYTFICGGESRNIKGDTESKRRANERRNKETNNYHDCEVFSVDWLTQLAREKEAEGASAVADA